MTRGDKIRSMTDEQISWAILKNNIDSCIDMEFCKNKKECDPDGPKDVERECTKCLIEWLKQEVET